ncbi:uncharacterized protein SRS1_15225 [Sporisorium reilianum f. sp. reilianum]|uniref:Uncharacterized protein n=1 Tax=Sporisorium reilianum f. sp. reilianum TaxID=72559 RepID=A0A2N8UIM3_9BASI|nr:uncharacterized protein SRS1_15225 [Sporisorium reilianum f. sp. reilianum]
MSQLAESSATLAEPSSHHQARDAEASETSFASTLTDDHDADLTAPLQSETSTVDLLGNGTKPSSSAWSEHEYSLNPPSSSIKAVTSSTSSHKGKQPSNDHYVDLDHQKLSTIDETIAASSSSYSHDRISHSSSANAFSQDDARRLYQDRGDHVDSPHLDAAPYSPSTYPPTSEEHSEAKRVQQNLERWAAEERQRRKAHRTSKVVSNRNSAVPGAGSLPHRLSMLRSAGYTGNTKNLGAGPSSERLAEDAEASPSVSHTASLGDRRRHDPTARRESASSGGAARGLHRPASPLSFDSAQSFGSLVSDEQRPNRKLPRIGSRVASASHDRQASGGSVASSNGLGHGANGSARDPFRDPSEGGAADVSTRLSSKRSSLKPTPTASRPIVTVGRASSIQRQALEASYASSKGKGKGRSMPTIVATDTEVEEDDDELSPGLKRNHNGENPFASSQDSQRRTRTTSTTLHQGGLDEEVAMEIVGRNKGLRLNGDLGGSSLGTDGETRPPPARTSTSSSKFRELGITEDDDWIDTVSRSMGKKSMRIARHAGSDEEERQGARKPWWTEWLCGCSRDFDDDEQAGRTNPME